MELVRKQPTTNGTPDRFIGDVWIDGVATGRDSSSLRLSVVRFAPGARNAWHAHALGQTLHVIEGRGLVQARGGRAVAIRAGDTVVAPPGEWHWHGATPRDFMTHLAMWEVGAEGVDSEWGAHVSDDEYRAAADDARG